MAVNAKYKVYTGSAWEQYYLETTAAQVLTNGSKQFVSANTKVNGQSFSLNSDGANASVTINGSQIVGNAAATSPSSSTSGLHYIDSSDAISAALGKLDAAAFAASQATPSEYLKNAVLSNSNKTITFTKQDNTTVVFNDSDTTYTFAEGSTNGAFVVTPSGGSAQTVSVHGLAAAAYKGTTDTVTSGSSDLVTSGAVATAIANLPKSVIFKGSLGTGGTITSLPTAGASYEGFEYKVITNGTYASQSAKVGDLFICAKTGTSTYEWVLIPSGDEPSGTVTSVNLESDYVGTVLNKYMTVSGGPITSSGTITIGLVNGYGDIKNPYASKSSNTVLAGPASGDGGIPGFRSLVPADIPDLSNVYLSVNNPKANQFSFSPDDDAYIDADEWLNGYNLQFHSGDGLYRFFNSSNDHYAEFSFDGSSNVSLSFPSTSGTIATTATSNKCFVGTATPSGARAGDIWIDTNN